MYVYMYVHTYIHTYIYIYICFRNLNYENGRSWRVGRAAARWPPSNPGPVREDRLVSGSNS